MTKTQSWSSPAYLATVCLVAIQVGIGVVMKSAQGDHGQYKFSPTSSVTISEFFKLLLSLSFFAIECWHRAKQGVAPGKSDLGAYSLMQTSAETEILRSSDDIDVDGIPEVDGKPPSTFLTPGLFWQYLWSELSTPTKFDVLNLSLLYLLVNNTIFACYRLSDPGTIALIKSSGTAVTAIIAIAALGTQLSRRQWTAIALQLVGIAITQYRPDAGVAYPPSTYLLLAFHVFLGAAAGVYNQTILKREVASLHVSNIFLYSAGSVLNGASHIVVRQLNPGEPGFFAGYDTASAILVIVSNVFVGLAITAVLKCKYSLPHLEWERNCVHKRWTCRMLNFDTDADAVIKCFATGVATGILLYLSTILFQIEISLLAIPGSIIVFAASYVYLVSPAELATDSAEPRGLAAVALLAKVSGKFPRSVFVSSTLTVFAIVALLWAPLPMPPQTSIEPPTTRPTGSHSPTRHSPLNSTVAFVRWNHPIPDRIPDIMKYEPFFHTVHLSMKDMLESPNEENKFAPEFVNLTHDQWFSTANPQAAVAKTMQLILDNEPDATGLLYFHFDAWIDPMGWKDVDLRKFAIPFKGGPYYKCTVEKPEGKWGAPWPDRIKGYLEKAKNIKPQVLDEESDIIHDPENYHTPMLAGCRGWADIYYVPRRFFRDYIQLTNHLFWEAFHELSVATMMHLISETRSRDKDGLVENLPCWGSCCSTNPKPDSIANHICGHKFDFREKDQYNSVFDRLRKDGAQIRH